MKKLEMKMLNAIIYISCLGAYCVQSLQYSKFILPWPVDYALDFVFFCSMLFLIFRKEGKDGSN